jgi:hypothetical protein
MKAHPKFIASAITAAVLAGAVHAAEAGAITTAVLAGAVPAKPVYHAAENAGGGQPTSTPTHTVPVKPTVKGQTEDEATGAVPAKSTDRLTIKTKSSPPFAPTVEDKKKTSTTDAHGLTGHEGHAHPR